MLMPRDAKTKEVISEVSRIVSELAGIQLGDKQATMVESRLKSRMSRLQIQDFDEYLEHLNKNLETESQALVSLLTTHHTYFFREFSHFEYLLNSGLDSLIKAAQKRPDKTIRIWSAACSTGQEAYSLAMFFRFHLASVAKDIKFEILGTDVDPKSVEIATNGVYKVEELKSTPAMYMNGNWIRGSGNVAGFYKANKQIRENVRFEPANLQSPEGFLAGKTFDLIFCRNVFIYFNEKQIQSVTQSMLNHMSPEGFLILGVSETLMGLNLDAKLTGPSVYRKTAAVAAQSATSSRPSTVSTAAPSARPAEKKIFRVLCVDDSPTIHALLGRILVPQHDFQIAAKAKNGQEALDILKTQTFDAITLDLHMPEVDGVTFLQKYTDRSTPILILSSVNRDEQSLGQKALSLGAFDYVEKPSLENLAQAGNEIRSKLKLGLQFSKTSRSQAQPQTQSKTENEKMEKKKKIRVLIVDDSVTIRDLLTRILSKDPIFEVVGQTDRPSQVAQLVDQLKPDLMTLDIHMPEMDGVTLLKKFDRRKLPPTVIISSISREEGPYVLDALESGAIDYIQKPSFADLMEMSATICERLKSAASAKVSSKAVSRKISTPNTAFDSEGIIVIGSSTGGTEALRVILESLPQQIPPTLIVQHIPPVFSKAFADRLNQLCPFEVKEAVDGEPVTANKVLIAPGGKQMAVVEKSGQLIVRITDDGPVNRHKPSVDYLFKTVAELKSKKVVAAILTGMGTDGAKQMKVLRDKGARTIAQDEATSIVFGMPKATIELGAAEFTLPLDKIAQQLFLLSIKKGHAKAG